MTQPFELVLITGAFPTQATHGMRRKGTALDKCLNTVKMRKYSTLSYMVIIFLKLKCIPKVSQIFNLLFSTLIFHLKLNF